MAVLDFGAPHGLQPFWGTGTGAFSAMHPTSSIFHGGAPARSAPARLGPALANLAQVAPAVAVFQTA
jgi:hypothetical protein